MSDCSGHTSRIEEQQERVNHPHHYGGGDNPYEAIKVIEAWGLGFHLGNTVKYISRAGKKDRSKAVEDLEKAAWYLRRYISLGVVDAVESIPPKFNPLMVARQWYLELHLGSVIFLLAEGLRAGEMEFLQAALARLEEEVEKR